MPTSIQLALSVDMGSDLSALTVGVFARSTVDIELLLDYVTRCAANAASILATNNELLSYHVI